MDKRTGDAINSDCECPAGKGPHGTCKHLAAVMLMLQHFTETGNVAVDKSCTENLQLFHKPKATYHGKSNWPKKKKNEHFQNFIKMNSKNCVKK